MEHTALPLALISEFAKCFLTWSGLGISQTRAIHMWSSCLVQLLVKGSVGSWDTSHRSLNPLLAPRPLRAEPMTPRTFSICPGPAINPDPVYCCGTSPTHSETCLLWPASTLRVHPCYSKCGPRTSNVNITWELFINAESQVSPHKDWIQIHSLKRSPGGVCTHSSWKRLALPHTF